MMSYIEPAPIKDKDNPLESMMQRFDKAVDLLGIFRRNVLYPQSAP
jgi:hypothetical protein